VVVFCILVANVAVGSAEMAVGLLISAVGGVVAGFWLFGFFMI